MSKAAAGDGNIRQRSDGLWEARITIGTNPGTGKPIRRSVYGKTQKEVREKKTELLRSLDTATYTAPDKTTVKAWADYWMQNFVETRLKQLTIDTYRSILKTHIIPRVGALRVQEITPRHIQELYSAMVKDGKSPKTISNVALVLTRLFETAVKQGMIASNPARAAEKPKLIKPEIKPLTDAEIPLFLSAIKDMPEENAFALCLFCGLREAECLGLSWDAVDFDNGRITVRQQLQKGKAKGSKYYIARSTKSGKSRVIEAPEIALDYLRREKRKQIENRLRAGEYWSNPDNLVFTNEIGMCLAIPTFYKHFKRVAAAIGRPDARPHDLRHTAATVALAAGADLKSVQDLLGHATASFTLDRYCHTSEKMMEDTANRLQSYYDSLTKRA